VLSTNGANKVESSVTRLQLASLEGDRLELAGDGEPLAGTYRRAQAAHIRGVVTYREWEPLRADARVIVELSRGGKPVALQTFLTRRQVPIDFDLSVPATDSGAEFEVTARIADHERTWFSAPHPMRVTAGADESVELLLRQGS
jgi:uncharacterized lipoprotein YbaY